MEGNNYSMGDATRLKLIVEGNIQMVGYRAFIKNIAVSLGIRGFVINLPSGTVEIFCEGEKKNLEIFKNKINIKSSGGGPFSINVSAIKETAIDKLPKETKTFFIDYGEEAKTSFEKTNLERLEVGSLILSEFRDASIEKFDVMENKYGDISTQMMKIEFNLTEMMKEFSDSNKNNAKLVETLIEKLDKVI